MEKEKLIDSLYDRFYLKDNEAIVLSDGFEAALIGVSASEPKVAIYDFFIALDCVIKAEPRFNFDQALEWLEMFIQIKLEESEDLTPIFIKKL
tara:strand:- start:1265 stop:1543 length:279 start_codon:yes stop_codon:yes gene_type:complete